jgi:ABC-type spermidine/putrescine transport system permease subunit II
LLAAAALFTTLFIMTDFIITDFASIITFKTYRKDIYATKRREQTNKQTVEIPEQNKQLRS